MSGPDFLLLSALAQAEYAACVNKLEKDLVSNYQQQFETLFSAEAPTWETHGNLMVSFSFSSFFSTNFKKCNYSIWA